MDLAPALVEEAEDARGAEGELENGGGAFVAATFAADGKEDVAGKVDRVIVKLDGDAGGAGEKAFVDAANFGPAALGAAKRIAHGGVVGRRPVFTHEDEVAGVEGAIKLSESVAGVGEVAKIFVAGNGIE